LSWNISLIILILKKKKMHQDLINYTFHKKKKKNKTKMQSQQPAEYVFSLCINSDMNTRGHSLLDLKRIAGDFIINCLWMIFSLVFPSYLFIENFHINKHTRCWKLYWISILLLYELIKRFMDIKKGICWRNSRYWLI